MKLKQLLLTSAVGFGLSAGIAAADAHGTTITIATVNNGDMIRKQGPTEDTNAWH